MDIIAPWTPVAVVAALVAAGSLLLSPRSKTEASFFRGREADGSAPGVWMLAFSQVTTWIFARSIMNAAILGYFFGIAGALAYAAYYLSFLTGAWIIRSLRFQHGFESVQAFLSDRFGVAGTASYDLVVGLRLLSEVFANLLVIGLIFGAKGEAAYVGSILLVGFATLGYSLLGGLSASIRTDALQMAMFLAALFALIFCATTAGGVEPSAILGSSPTPDNAGWVLLAVALLQVWSYPLHDPVMMDRGFIADRRTTMASFYHAAWISTLCILAFGVLGVWAGLSEAGGRGLCRHADPRSGADADHAVQRRPGDLLHVDAGQHLLQRRQAGGGRYAAGAADDRQRPRRHGGLPAGRAASGVLRREGSVRRGRGLRHRLHVPGAGGVLLALARPARRAALELSDRLRRLDRGGDDLLSGGGRLFGRDAGGHRA